MNKINHNRQSFYLDQKKKQHSLKRAQTHNKAQMELNKICDVSFLFYLAGLATSPVFCSFHIGCSNRFCEIRLRVLF